MVPVFRRTVTGSLAAAVTLAVATHASAADGLTTLQPPSVADEPKGKSGSLAVGPKGKPQTVAVDVKRLGAELDLYAAQAHRTRVATALTGVGLGLVLVPAGIVLLGRTDGISRALVIGMIIGGSAQLVSVPFVFLPTRMDEIRNDFMSRPASMESKATIRQFENEWREAAESSRRKRFYVGSTLLVLGTLNVTAGMTCLLAPAGILGMSRKTQYTVGGVMMGVGTPVTTVGVRFLFEWSQEETSWEAYRSMKSDARSLGRLELPTIGMAPIPGGALGVATMQF